jgi:glycosyltransferase involved in cell wall biosynthesis
LALRVAREIWTMEGRDGPFDIVEAPNFRGEGVFYSMRPGRIFGSRLSTPSALYADAGHGRFMPHWKLREGIERLQIRRSHYIISNSSANMDLVLGPCRASPRFDPVVIPHGIRLETPSARKPKARKPYVLSVTKFEPRKGVGHLIESFEAVASRFPDHELVIVGRDVRPWGVAGSWRRRYMEGASASLRSRIRIHDFVEERDLQGLYADCEVFVAPSLYESFGLVFLEAMRHERAVVGCRAGGVPEVVEDDVTGILVPPADSGALGEAICSLLADPDRRVEMGRAGRRRLEERFDRERMADESLEFYERILGGSG